MSDLVGRMVVYLIVHSPHGCLLHRVIAAVFATWCYMVFLTSLAAPHLIAGAGAAGTCEVRVEGGGAQE